MDLFKRIQNWTLVTFFLTIKYYYYILNIIEETKLAVWNNTQLIITRITFLKKYLFRLWIGQVYLTAGVALIYLFYDYTQHCIKRETFLLIDYSNDIIRCITLKYYCFKHKWKWIPQFLNDPALKHRFNQFGSLFIHLVFNIMFFFNLFFFAWRNLNTPPLKFYDFDSLLVSLLFLLL